MNITNDQYYHAQQRSIASAQLRFAYGGAQYRSNEIAARDINIGASGGNIYQAYNEAYEANKKKDGSLCPVFR